MKIAICDDVNEICAHLKFILEELKITMNKSFDITIFNNGEDIIDVLNSGTKFDIIFLDIELGGRSGIEVAKFIRNKLNDNYTKIIFCSGTTKYDRQLFEVQPLNFLEKPFDIDSVQKVMHKAINVLENGMHEFCFKIGYEMIKIPICEILYFESKGKRIKLVSKNQTYTFYGKITTIFQEVSKYNFIEPHRSFLVNYSHISSFEYSSLKLSNGETISISQGRRKSVKLKRMELEKEKQTWK